MDCFGTYFTHVQACDNVRVRTATKWTASVRTLHMSKPVITFVFKVLRNGLLRYILYTLHMSKPVITFVFRVLRNGIPAQERHLRKESGKMATEIAPKLKF